MITMSMTSASTKIATIPATIWSLFVGLVTIGEPGPEPADPDHRSDGDHGDVGDGNDSETCDQNGDRQR